MEEHNIHPKSLLLCAHATCLRRSKATFNKQFPDIETICSPHPIPKGFWTPHRIKDLLGEFKRLKIYAEKGDIAQVDVPREVQEIVDELIDVDELDLILHS